MKSLFSIFFILCSSVALGQTTIEGTVFDQKGTTIPGVNIYLKGTFEGTSSEIDGSFSLQTDTEGEVTVVFQTMGFKTFESSQVLNGEKIIIRPVLKKTINEMTAVTISAGALEASDEKKSIVLKPVDIVTVPSAMGDIVGAFQTLPGTAAVGNDGRLFVRGGDASETAIFIDGMKVGNAFGTTAANVPTRTRFNPNLFKGSFFSTGGYSAEYGHALSSALALHTVDMPARNQGDISLMSVGAGYNQTLVGKNNSLTASANYFDLSPYQSMVRQNFDWERAPYGWDAEVSGRQKWGNSGMLKAYFHTSSNGMEIWQKSPASQDRGTLVGIYNNYNFGQLSFKQVAGESWSLYGGISFSSNTDNFSISGLNVKNQNQVVHSKMVAVKDFSDKFSLKTGVEHFVFSYSENLLSEDLERSFQDHQPTVFAEADYYFTNQLILRTGLRSGYSSLGEESWVDPRFSLAYKFNNQGHLSFAAGRYSQSAVEQLRIFNTELQNTVADHLILNYLLNANGRTIRAEAFYKDYKNLLTFEGMPYQYQNVAQEGNGFARGMDIFYRDQKSFKNTDFWVTYSFVDSKRVFAQFNSMVQPWFAPKHNGSVVVKHFIQSVRSQLSVSWTINDGYTYTDPNFPGEMNAKTRSFQDLSIGWSYLPKPNLIIHLACNNVYGRENVFGYQFSPQANEAGRFESQPVGLQAPRFIFWGSS